MSTQMENAYRYIKQKILNGTYKPSQKLNESDLSAEINASRNTIKKALLKLQQENLVSIETNKGATVKDFSLDEIIHYLEIREVLEGLIAKTAASNISDGKLVQMEGILEEMRGHLNHQRFDDYSKCNLAFHNVIYEASPNVQAVSMVQTIKTQLRRFQLKTILIPGRNEESFKEHQKILNAFQVRDEKWAEDAVKYHIAQIRRTIVENYSFLV
ncbi:GntR family transcriptional regulator [Bacillus smithii]|uniref:GntR family transcriptional regulator n=1 Tax=Bacillus smithii TaxID=1479 RepID=UPI003D1D2541